MTGIVKTTTYDQITAALQMLGSELSAGECHGMLCGALCGPEAFDAEGWFQHVIGYEEDLHLSSLDLNHVVHVLVRDTQSGLSSQEFEFALLLPDDDTSLADRAQGLSDWCHGFISGFGLAAVSELSEDAKDFLKDLRQISRIEVGESDAKADEQAFFELSEYCRIGAMLLREETRFDESTTLNETPKLH